MNIRAIDTFTTPSLTLRRFVPEDWQALHQLMSDRDVTRWLPAWRCTEDTCRQAALERSKGDTHWAVTLKGASGMIGQIHLEQVYNPAFFIWEVGYAFHPLYQRRGYATEACKRILTHGFRDLDAHRIIATCDPENTASWRLMERLGMRREACYRRCLYLRPPEEGEEIDWRDEFLYAILSEEWPPTTSA